MESFYSHERNLDRDRRTFVEAINLVSIEEIPMVFDEGVSDKLDASLGETKLFILGEVHGVKENVDVIYTLFKKFGFRQLALEWGPELKASVEKFIESGNIDFDAIKDSADGRITAGHFALIKKLRDQGLLEMPVCFDGGSVGDDWNERDAWMAKNIMANLSNKTTLVVAGNLHTKTESIILDGERGECHPMGERIKALLPNVPSGRIEYVTGQFHNYGTREFSVNLNEEQRSSVKCSVSEDGLYEFVLPEAHSAVVPNPSERIK